MPDKAPCVNERVFVIIAPQLDEPVYTGAVRNEHIPAISLMSAAPPAVTGRGCSPPLPCGSPTGLLVLFFVLVKVVVIPAADDLAAFELFRLLKNVKSHNVLPNLTST
jgi:hypothetical protein